MPLAIKSIIRFLLMKKITEKINDKINKDRAIIEKDSDIVVDKERVSKKKVTSLILILTAIIYASSTSGLISKDFADIINAIIVNNPELTTEIVESFGEP